LAPEVVRPSPQMEEPLVAAHERLVIVMALEREERAPRRT
jgi:hypothetical protein